MWIHDLVPSVDCEDEEAGVHSFAQLPATGATKWVCEGGIGKEVGFYSPLLFGGW